MDIDTRELTVLLNEYREQYKEKIASYATDKGREPLRDRIQQDERLNAHLIDWVKVSNQFDSRLQVVRENQNNLNQIWLAYLLDLSPFTISSWEHSYKDEKSTNEKRSSFAERRKEMWESGKRLPSLKQAFMLAKTTETSLNGFFLDDNYLSRIKDYQYFIKCLYSLEDPLIKDKYQFFSCISPQIEAYLAQEEKDIEQQRTIYEDYSFEEGNPETNEHHFDKTTCDNLQETFVTDLFCLILSVYPNEDFINAYEHLGIRRSSFYLKNAMDILFYEKTRYLYNGLEYQNNLERLLISLNAVSSHAKEKNEDAEFVKAYFHNRSNTLRAVEILRNENRQRKYFLGVIQKDYQEAKEKYSAPVSSTENEKKILLDAFEITYDNTNLDSIYEKAMELLRPIAKNLKF